VARWVGDDGWTVEVIVLNQRSVYRVRCLGYHVAYARSVEEVARHVDLASLCEVVELPRRQ
jgi:hypothetical protein